MNLSNLICDFSYNSFRKISQRGLSPSEGKGRPQPGRGPQLLLGRSGLRVCSECLAKMRFMGTVGVKLHDNGWNSMIHPGLPCAP